MTDLTKLFPSRLKRCLTLQFLGVLAIAALVAACEPSSQNANTNVQADKAVLSLIGPHHLRTESLTNPITVDRAQPRLSWRSQVKNQHAYEIAVASNIAALLTENRTCGLRDA